MEDKPNSPRRRSMRLAGYDHSQPWAYFVTVVAYHRQYLFGEIREHDGVDFDHVQPMRLSTFGKLVQFTRNDLVNHIPQIELGPFIVMPNHIHGIIFIIEPDSVGAGSVPAPKSSEVTLSEIVRQFKTHSGRRINVLRATPGAPVWQRNYYDHIIRNQTELQRISDYICGNPRRWLEDPEYHK